MLINDVINSPPNYLTSVNQMPLIDPQYYLSCNCYASSESHSGCM